MDVRGTRTDHQGCMLFFFSACKPHINSHAKKCSLVICVKRDPHMPHLYVIHLTLLQVCGDESVVEVDGSVMKIEIDGRQATVCII